MIRRLRQLLEMVRFSHTLFALPFALLAAVMAWAADEPVFSPVRFRWTDVLGILACMVAARSAAMAFNRLADRRFDALNPRTRSRHLPTGVLTVAGVVAFTAVSSMGFVAGTLLFLPNWIPLAAAVPVLLFLMGYSYAKRFTALSHWWLGTALALSPLAAWTAIRAEVVAWPPLVLGAAVALWVAGFDIIYACQDYAFDVSMRLHSVPARLGIPVALRLAALCHVGMVLALAALPTVYPAFGTLYWAGIAGIGVLLAYEHWLVRPDDLSRVNQAFFQVNAVVSSGLLLIGVIDLLTHATTGPVPVGR
jgi:4-hydroxybenzoate polyprenyltransferase